MVVEECYRAKAAKVMVEWSYMPLTKLNVNNMSNALLGTVEAFEEETQSEPTVDDFSEEDVDEIDGGLMPGLQPAAGFFHGATSFICWR